MFQNTCADTFIIAVAYKFSSAFSGVL